MEQALVGAVVGANVQVGIETVISLIREMINLVGDFKEDMEKLESRLIMIQSILYDAEMQQVASRAVKLWLEKLENLAFEAENALDEFDYRLLHEKRNAMGSGTTIPEFAMSLFSSPSSDHRQKLGRKIREINQELESISEEARNFGLQIGSVGARAPAAGSDSFAGLETDSFTVDPIFIGRDNDVSRIVEMLTSVPTGQQKFSILPIVGMGGLGKTTLTRKVFNHEKIQTHFGEHIWVHVSTNFDPVSLLKKILTTLTLKDVEAESKQVVLKKLKEALASKTYLLILDDVWNQDRQKWGGFVNSLSGINSKEGNAIIVTTRNETVASIVKTHDMHKLNDLSEEDCWSIIKKFAFEGGRMPPAFENIGRNIAKKCRGSPIAASVVGGALRGKSISDWFSVQEKWLSNIADGAVDNIFKILKLSYDNLPSPSLKKCFAYCSIFPKGYEIKRQQLIELWMAEGFLQPHQGNDIEDVGNKYFNLLLQNSLLQIGQRESSGDVIHCCSMHDLVHELARSLLNSRLNENSNGSYQVRYIGDENGGSPIPKKQAKCLRTLFIGGAVSNTKFSNFERLHALTLMGYDVEKLPSSIRKLIHLRYLDISGTRIHCLPNSIGELYHLQTFSAGSWLKELPSAFKYLISLRHLHISDQTEFPHEVGKLTSLQALPYFPVGEEEGRRIIELGGLTNLKGELVIFCLENVRGKEEAKGACLFQKPNLVELVLCWSESREGETNDENVLEGLQPHPNVKSLRITRFKGSRFPLWTSKMAVRDEVEDRWLGLRNLTEIALNGCTNCEEIPMLGHLPHLKFLILNGLTNVRSIGSSFYGMDKCSSSSEVCRQTINVFPALERLELRSMSNLEEWVEVAGEVKVFPCLESLKIEECKKLMSVPCHFSSLTKLRIAESDGLEGLPDQLFYNNKNLTELEIFNCPNLRELPDGLQTLHSPEKLAIKRCSIPCSSGGQSHGLTSSLCILSIKGCKKLINLPGEIIESSAPSLERLHLKDLTSVTNFSEVMNDCLPKMCRLTKLAIVNVRQFIPIEFGKIPKLQRLQVGPSPDSRDCGSFSKTVDGMEDWDSLPDQLQHLTTLSNLELCNFGRETLPEWFGNLSSLKRLALYGCKQLRSMPSKEAMQSLTKLEYLSIRECPELEKRCKIEQQNDDSDSDEWPKISHIPQVRVGSHEFVFGEKVGQLHVEEQSTESYLIEQLEKWSPVN